MKRGIVLAAGLALAFAAAASDSVRFGNQLVVLGDAEAHVLKVAGRLSLRADVQNQYGAVVGHRLDYDVGNKTVSIYVGQDGRVTKIAETYN
ncbi:DUF2845 domain-containing protein [Fulvimonas sp. R45]|uniref:DUF2845 domain-containing protein n=1 Tax=Fulvimonas sp. R45 TaxID=3045937 RepID=UPI00265ECFE1|nr:DUF2845 domain-containing protein [Fulvimonas sp. R45]MDO1528161.1 DUF2845 domain-containing protein [Fulvimonas sp. R45]